MTLTLAIVATLAALALYALGCHLSYRKGYAAGSEAEHERWAVWLWRRIQREKARSA